MALIRSHAIRQLRRYVHLREIPCLIGSFQSCSSPGVMDGSSVRFFSHGMAGIAWYTLLTNSCYKNYGRSSQIVGWAQPLHSSMRLMTTQIKPPPQARQMGALKVSMLSPGIIYEPYAPREPISFLQRWFTRSGWRRTKEDIITEMKSAYAIAKLRKATGYSKNKFYEESVQLYKEINTFMANGDKTSLRKAVTENMYSTLKNEIKQRESSWSSVYWELVLPIVKMRTLRARMIGIDKNDLNKAFVQLTIEFLSKQKFEAYDSKDNVVAGDKTKEVLVRDIWVFERSLFHPGAYWRLCGRISV